MGGYDIYKSEKVGEKWGTPENLGYPINSPDDDTYFFMTSDGKTAYFSSFRVGGMGDKDIYLAKAIPNVIIKGEIVDTTGINKGKPISGFAITFTNLMDSTFAAADSTYNPTMDSLNNPIIPEKTGYNVSILSARKYLIHGMKNGDTLFTEVFNVEFQNDEGIEIEKNFYLAYTDSNEVLLADTKDNNDISEWKINDIYFDFDKSNVRKDAIPELENVIKIMKAYPDMALQLKVIGHTDSKGPQEYNLKLSKRRALAAINYIISKGIEKERLILEYKGEAEPKVPNTKPDGSDNPEGRAINRRTEFRFVDKTN